MAKISSKNKRRLLRALLRRDGALCGICRYEIDLDLPRGHDEAWTFEHLKPQAEGGTNAQDNLVLAHRVCNHGRHHRIT
jgi:5-methylcytosine-specific restriction endonuclease McrA